jgi:hypothetical protein
MPDIPTCIKNNGLKGSILSKKVEKQIGDFERNYCDLFKQQK